MPVDFTRPVPADYGRFAEALRAGGEQRALVHCRMNLRASSFVFLYRAIDQPGGAPHHVPRPARGANAAPL